MRYTIILQYKGTNYHGWQIQNGANTVQGTLTKCFSDILSTKIDIMGCGRTDTGVHAKIYVACFDCFDMEEDKLKWLLYKVNSYLPYDIKVFDIFTIENTFNPRFDALSRCYRYYISLSKEPFSSEFAWQVNKQLDIHMLNTASRVLYQYDDFTSFSKLNTQTYTNNCQILYAHWKKEGNYLIFTIKANRFLRNMVRAIVGTLIDCGTNKLSIEDFCNIIESKDRAKASSSVPAKGLFLEEIEYESRKICQKMFYLRKKL